MPIRIRSGMWHYRFYVNGQEYTGNTDLAGTERNKTAALRAEAKARELVVAGRAHELRLEIRPFNEAAAMFLAWADTEYAAHPNSAKRLRTSFASLTTFFGRKSVSAILKGHINDYKAWRRREHQVREVTIRHDLHALSVGFQYWMDHNWVRDNPVRGVEIPSDKDAVRIHVLTAAEEMAYFEAARKHAKLYDLGRLMIQQGCRPEEILSLKIGDVDLETGRLEIRAGKSDAAKRKLRLTAESREICARRIAAAKSGWLFEGKRKGTHATKLNNSHNAVLDSIGGARFVLYDLRHTFATRAAEKGMPIATLAAILGHGDLRSVMKYVHVRVDAMDAAMDRLDSLSGSCPVGKAETVHLGQSRDTQGKGRNATKIQ